MAVARAKRLGWDEGDPGPDLEPYSYADDDLVGELVVRRVPELPGVHPAMTLCTVGGQEADPATVQVLDENARDLVMTARQIKRRAERARRTRAQGALTDPEVSRSAWEKPAPAGSMNALDVRGRSQAAVAAAIDAAAKDRGLVREHGMENTEPMRTFNLHGVDVDFSDLRVAAETVRGLAAADVPTRLWEETDRIVLSAQRNKNDAYWEKRYGIKGFESLATGGDGTVVVYSNRHLPVSPFAHEAGHNVAFRRWGNSEPPPNEFNTGEAAVTAYGARTKGENFAEACERYTVDRARLRATHPRTYKMVREILG